MRYIWHYESSLGNMTMASDGSALTGLWFDGQKYYPEDIVFKEPEEPDKGLPTGAIRIFQETERWLSRYFTGDDPDFEVPLAPQGTAFQMAVLKLVRAIPYGETRTYGQLAEMLAQKEGKAHVSAQAVGQALGHNPLLLVIPCHRVVGADGSLTGYAGGMERKKALLALEQGDQSSLV